MIFSKPTDIMSVAAVKDAMGSLVSVDITLSNYMIVHVPTNDLSVCNTEDFAMGVRFGFLCAFLKYLDGIYNRY